jgi:hypothetical protein
LKAREFSTKRRLPTNAVLGRHCRFYELIPENGDFLAKAEKLLRRYLWSAFFPIDTRTQRHRHGRLPTSKAIKALLKKPGFTDDEIGSQCRLNRQPSTHWRMSIP